jgi:hypothetical protein
MKKLSLAGIMLATFVTGAFAQKTESVSNIKVNILSPLVRTFSGFYERKISPNTSVQLGLSYTGAELDDQQLRGWSITPEFRYYASQKEAMQGFYVAPFMRFGNFEVSDYLAKADLKSIGGGLLIGNQWIFSKGLSLDVFLGPSYSSGKLKVTEGQTEPDVPATVNGVGLRAGLTLGIVF